MADSLAQAWGPPQDLGASTSGFQASACASLGTSSLEPSEGPMR